MNKQKEISATEKLLDFIRTQPDSPEQQDSSAHAEKNTPIELELDTTLSMAGGTTTPPAKEQQPPQPAETKTDAKKQAPNADQKITKDSTASHHPIHFTPSPQKKNLFNLAPNLLSKIKIGVDIQDNCINLAKIQISGAQRKLLSCQSISFLRESDDSEKSIIHDQVFKGVLSQALASFCPPHKKPELWCSFAASKAKSHNVVIPKIGDKELANAVYWSVKKEFDFNDKTTKFDFSILKEIKKAEQNKILVLATLTPMGEVTALRSLFNSLGYPLTGITSQAAAVHNLLQQDHSPDKTTASIHLTMGTDSSSLDLFFREKILFSREIKTGIESFLESVLDLAHGLGVVIGDDNARNYVFCPVQTNDESPDENKTLDDLPIAELKVIERLIRQLSRTFEYCTTNFDIPRVAELYTSGSTVLNDTILQQIETKLGIKCSRLDHSRSQITLPETQEMTPGQEQLIALGLALSKKSRTSNSIFTYADRLAEKTATKINQIISIVTIILALACGGLFTFQHHDLKNDKKAYNKFSAELESKYQQYPRTKSTNFANNAIQKIKSAQKNSREKIIRFQAVAIISRISSEVPDEIRITSLSLQSGNKGTISKGLKNAKNTKNSSRERVRLQGFVNSADSSQEFVLLKFLKQLARIDFAEPPSLLSSSQAEYNGKEILTFKINLPIQLLK